MDVVRLRPSGRSLPTDDPHGIARVTLLCLVAFESSPSHRYGAAKNWSVSRVRHLQTSGHFLAALVVMRRGFPRRIFSFNSVSSSIYRRYLLRNRPRLPECELHAFHSKSLLDSRPHERVECAGAATYDDHEDDYAQRRWKRLGLVNSVSIANSQCSRIKSRRSAVPSE